MDDLLDKITVATLKEIQPDLRNFFDIFFAVESGLCCVFCKTQFIWIGGPICNCHRPIVEPFTYR